MSSRDLSYPVRRAVRRPLVSLTAATFAATLLLAGCGDRKPGASQVAAKVNKEEISVHQINFVLQQQRGLKPEQAETAGRQVLERLIDQELAVQKAQEMKIDRDPRVVQQIEQAKREIVARAYLEKVGEAAAKPSADDVKKYYDDMPALFRERRVYSVQELAIEARPDQVAALRTQLGTAKNINEFIDYLKNNNFRFIGNQAVRPAEQLPLTMLGDFAKMKDGQAMLVPSANGAQVFVIASSRTEPVDEAKARPAIEQFLYNDTKRRLAESEIKSLRTDAKIEYVGKFAEAASAPAGGTGMAAGTASPAPTAAPATQPAAQPAQQQAATPATPARAASGLDAKSIDKGLSGLK